MKQEEKKNKDGMKKMNNIINMTEFLIKNILAEILFDNRICESLEDKHIVDFFYDKLLLEKLLYGEPVTVPELRALLRQKILNFEFIKLDGEIRPAKGTTMMKYVPQSQHPKGIRPSSPKVATFYDLDKKDWRSVSQRSKEIVLKKDEDTGKPIVSVTDKPKGPGDISVQPERPEEPEVAPEREPEIPEVPEEPEVTVSKIKPIETTERTKMFHFVNPVTGASKDIEMTAADAVKELKKMGKGWKLEDEKEYKRREEEIEKASSEESPDILNIGDIRNYLNRKKENVNIEIIGEDPYGGVYAKGPNNAIFKIPASRMKNVGKKIEKPKTKSEDKSIIKKMENKHDLDNLEADEI